MNSNLIILVGMDMVSMDVTIKKGKRHLPCACMMILNA
jgi:hypothetical protein